MFFISMEIWYCYQVNMSDRDSKIYSAVTQLRNRKIHLNEFFIIEKVKLLCFGHPIYFIAK